MVQGSSLCGCIPFVLLKSHDDGVSSLATDCRRGHGQHVRVQTASAIAPRGRRCGRSRQSNRQVLYRRYYDPGTGQFMSMDPAVILTQAPFFYASEDPVNESDPNGLGWCPLGHVNSNPNSGCRGSGVLNTISNVAGYVQLGADTITAIPVVGEIAAPITVPVSEISGAVSTVATCANTFYNGHANAVQDCFSGLIIYEASGGFASYGSLKDLAQLGSDLWGWVWTQASASQTEFAGFRC